MSLAFVFPGQGSQSVGMLADLAASAPEVSQVFDEASAALGYDLWSLTQKGPAESLDQTHRTQPAMLTAGVAVWRVWAARGGPAPVMLAGHSLGEYTALVCASALGFSDAVRLVEERGKLMQAAVEQGAGAMAALLGLDDDAVVDACTVAAQGDVVEPVNFNAPGQVVIAGSADAVERAVEVARERGARRAMMLPVSVPAHSSLMRDAAAGLEQALASVELQSPNVPVCHNAGGFEVDGPDQIRAALVRQLYSPVRWTDSIVALRERGANTIAECGPGKVLSGLVRRIDRSLKTLPMTDDKTLDAALTALQENDDE